MIKVTRIKVYNIANAIYSARNPLNSWEKSDSDLEHDIIGENDLELARKLYRAGSEHRKFLRQIFVSMDITAPLYWWPEFDTYKIGTVANSCSRMHTIHKKPLTRADFSDEGLMLIDEDPEYGKIERNLYDVTLDELIQRINQAIGNYNRYGDKRHWNIAIKLLPPCYNQLRTVTMNYENVANIIRQRTGHKLDEWGELVKILWGLPYVKEIMGDDENGDIAGS